MSAFTLFPRYVRFPRYMRAPERSVEDASIDYVPGNYPAIEAAVAAGFVDARPLSSNTYKIKLARNAALRTIELAARA